jgi:hypothetical protein
MKSVNATCIKKFVYVLCYSRMQIHTIFYPRQPASEVPLPTLIRVYTIPGTKWLLLLDKCGEWFPLPAFLQGLQGLQIKSSVKTCDCQDAYVKRVKIAEGVD